MSSLSKYTDNRFGGSQSIMGDPYYNPMIIDQMLPNRQNETYMRELDRERVECDLAFMHGTMKDFKINYKFNSLIGLPAGTYSLRVTNSFLNLFVGNFLLANYYAFERQWTYPTADYKTNYIGMKGRRTDYDAENDQNVDVLYRIAYESLKDPNAFSYNGKNRIFSMMDTHKYIDIFRRGMYFFLGNELFIGIRIIPFKDFSYLVIVPNDEIGLDQSIIDVYMENDLDWRMILAPQSNYSWVKINPNEGFTEDGINISLFTDYKETNPFINEDNIFLLATKSGSMSNASNMMNLHLSTIIKPEDGEYMYSLDTDEIHLLQNLYTNNDIDVIVFHFRNVAQVVDIGDSKEPFILPFFPENENSRKTYVVPPENVIVWKIDNLYNRIMPDPDTYVELYYPNAYKLSGESFDSDNESRLLFFCAAEKRYESTALSDRKNEPKYYCEIAPYVEFMGNEYAKKSADGSICEYITHYEPIHPNYGWRNYMENEFSELPVDNNTESWYKYQAEKFKQFAENDRSKVIFYTNAVRNAFWKYIHEYDVYVKDINLMNQTPVNDNSGQRFSEANPLITFTQPMHYIKVNVKHDHPIEVMLYIDEEYVVDRRIIESGFDRHIYFPAFLVDENSVIHIIIYENYHDSELDYNMIFTSTDSTEDTGNGEYLNENDEVIAMWPHQYYFYTINNEFLQTVNEEYLVYGEEKVTDEVFGKSQNLPGYFLDFNPNGLFAYVSDSKHKDYLKYLSIGEDKDIRVCYGIRLQKDEVKYLSENEELKDLMEDGAVTVDINIPIGNAPVYNRVYAQTVDLSQEALTYETEYMNNGDVFSSDHELYLEFTEPYIKTCIYAPSNYTRTRYIMYINDELISEENRMKLHRFFTIKDNKEVCYIYIPKSLVTDTSVLRFETLCIDDRLPEGIKNFKNTPEIRLYLNNEEYFNVPISIISTDTYKFFREDNVSSTDEVRISGWSLGKNEKRIRIWMIDPDEVSGTGTLLNRDNYEITFPDEWGGDLSITFKNLSFTGMNLYIEHLPFDVTIVRYITDYDRYSRLIFNVPNYYLDPFWEFFADGKRIPANNIIWLTPNKILLHDMDLFDTLEMHHYDVLNKQIEAAFGYYYTTSLDEYINTNQNEKLYYGNVTAGGNTYNPSTGEYADIDPKQVVGYNYTTDTMEYLTTSNDEILFFGDPRSKVPVKYYTMMDHLLEVDQRFKEYYVSNALQSENFQYWK